MIDLEHCLLVVGTTTTFSFRVFKMVRTFSNAAGLRACGGIGGG